MDHVISWELPFHFKLFVLKLLALDETFLVKEKLFISWGILSPKSHCYLP